MPTLKRNMATTAAMDRTRAQTFTVASTGASKASGPQRKGRTSPKMVWTANQTARLRITPTTAAVMADKAPASALLPRRVSMNGAPRKIHRKHGMKVTQVASRPPSVPARSGCSMPGSR